MKYKARWNKADGYVVETEDGLYLTPSDIEALLNQEPVTTMKGGFTKLASKAPNVIHENGVYLILVWAHNLIWSTYVHEREIMFMDNPEVGTIAMLPNEHRVKVIALGTEHSLKGELFQMSVFVKPWPEIGLDGFIKD